MTKLKIFFRWIKTKQNKTKRENYTEELECSCSACRYINLRNHRKLERVSRRGKPSDYREERGRRSKRLLVLEIIKTRYLQFEKEHGLNFFTDCFPLFSLLWRRHSSFAIIAPTGLYSPAFVGTLTSSAEWPPSLQASGGLAYGETIVNLEARIKDQNCWREKENSKREGLPKPLKKNTLVGGEFWFLM